jgi:hypothetical protein
MKDLKVKLKDLHASHTPVVVVYYEQGLLSSFFLGIDWFDS